jgi:hypothetical protein
LVEKRIEIEFAEALKTFRVLNRFDLIEVPTAVPF